MTCWLSPQCILQPESSLDVSRALLISTFLGSHFSVRSGGHNPNIGFSSIGSEGMLIDMAKLDQVTVPQPGGSIASIGPGNRWGKVYETLSAAGRMAVGGRANDIGVGGLLLGGGLSYWSSIHGLACSKVVLGNGSIVNANQKSNPDLWWALKGGGANFGIVTRFDIETIDNNQIWFEGLLVDADQQDKLIEAAVDYAAEAEDDVDASATYNLGSTGGAVYLAYNKPVERPELFQRFYDIPHQTIVNSTVGTSAEYHNAVSALNPFSTLRRQWDLKTLLEHYERYEKASADVQTRLNATMYLAPQIFSKAAIAATEAKGGSPLQLANESYCFLEVMINWTDAEHDEAAMQALVDVGKDLAASAHEMGTDLNFHYMNDAGPDQDVLASYGSMNRMRAVSRAYDPYQVFQHLQNDGFLLGKGR
ncbi:FAD-binding domain-containing protein [Apiospora marii]|uniref:FAD-binding domain-containing protein n=1 Tax=Apiospora marii TaxID=335849 RepID=A0ABR1SQ98_9PEZI